MHTHTLMHSQWLCMCAVQDCDLAAVKAGSGAFSLTSEREQAAIKQEVRAMCCPPFCPALFPAMGGELQSCCVLHAPVVCAVARCTHSLCVLLRAARTRCVCCPACACTSLDCSVLPQQEQFKMGIARPSGPTKIKNCRMAWESPCVCQPRWQEAGTRVGCAQCVSGLQSGPGLQKVTQQHIHALTEPTQSTSPLAASHKPSVRLCFSQAHLHLLCSALNKSPSKPEVGSLSCVLWHWAPARCMLCLACSAPSCPTRQRTGRDPDCPQPTHVVPYLSNPEHRLPSGPGNQSDAHTPHCACTHPHTFTRTHTLKCARAHTHTHTHIHTHTRKPTRTRMHTRAHASGGPTGGRPARGHPLQAAAGAHQGRCLPPCGPPARLEKPGGAAVPEVSACLPRWLSSPSYMLLCACVHTHVSVCMSVCA